MKLLFSASLILLGFVGSVHAQDLVRTQFFSCYDLNDDSSAEMALMAQINVDSGRFVTGTITINGESVDLDFRNTEFSEEEENEYSLRSNVSQLKNRVIYCSMTGSQG
jgi:hypothetical protein